MPACAVNIIPRAAVVAAGLLGGTVAIVCAIIATVTIRILIAAGSGYAGAALAGIITACTVWICTVRNVGAGAIAATGLSSQAAFAVRGSIPTSGIAADPIGAMRGV